MPQATESVKEAEEEAGWNLEDEAGFDDEVEEQQAQVSEKPAAEPKPEEGAMDLKEGGDEIDPLDAFMADNEAQVGPIKTEESAAAAAPKGDGHQLGLVALVYCTACQGHFLKLAHFSSLHIAENCHAS